MTERFQNRYRIASSRLHTWDYRSAAPYFITICTKGREHYFGEIVNREMRLSRVGVIADILWHEIKNHAGNVELGEFVVMPNHVHGILILNGVGGNGDMLSNGHTDGERNIVNANAIGTVGTDGIVGIGDFMVETRHALSLRFVGPQLPEPPSQSPSPRSNHPPKTMGQQRFQNQGKNTVSSIIGSYKSAVTKHSHRLGFEFGWQSRFYDHIIRDSQSFDRIQRYIADNPALWQEDKFYTR
ncbi:transposase [Flavihumibacter sp. R14]|nr:transposase [Flavihumibacter soli]